MTLVRLGRTGRFAVSEVMKLRRRIILTLLQATIAVVCTNDGSLTTAADEPATTPARQLPFPVAALEFSADGRWLAAAAGSQKTGGGIIVWRTADWTPHIVEREDQGCCDVSFSPDGSRLAYASSGPQAGLIDHASGKVIRRFEAETSRLHAIAFSPDGSTLISGGNDRQIKFWNVESGALEKAYDGHSDEVWDADLSPDGALVLSCSRDHTARLWDGTADAFNHVFRPSEYAVRRGGFSNDGKLFWIATFESKVRVYETATGNLRARIESDGSDAALSHDDKLLATCGHSGTAHVYAVAFGPAGEAERTHIADLIRQLDDDDYEIRTSASANLVAIGLVAEPQLREALDSESAEVRIQARKTRLEILSPGPTVRLDGHAGDVRTVSFSPDNRLLATGSEGGSIKVWEVRTWKNVRDLANPIEALGR